MIAALAKLLGLTPEHAEASMHSERAAKAVLTRRQLFAAGAALATGAVFSFGAAEPDGFWVQNPKILSWTDIEITFDGQTFRLGGLPMRVIDVVGARVTRKIAGPMGLDITVSGDEPATWLENGEIEILRKFEMPSFRGRARP